MSCSFCRINIKKSFKCDICNLIHCSSQCLLRHFAETHSKSGNQPRPTVSSNLLLQKIARKSARASPYITEGTYYSEIPQSNFKSSFSKMSCNEKNMILGAGTFGQVFLAKNKFDNKIYAVKHMNKQRLLQSLNTLTPVYTEIDIHSRLDHPNIIKLYQANETPAYFEMILEYANCGTLFTHIQRKKGFSESQAFKYFIQVCNAIYFLHQNNLIHRDLKPENILMFDDDRVKLCDFGWCVELSTKNRSTYCGTFEYMAPEIVNQHNYDKAIDIWSLGILLYELIHGFSPFRAVNKKNSSNEVIGNIKKHNLVFHKAISNECKELITEMLCEDVNQRIKIEGIFNSKFVKRYEKEGYCFSLFTNQNPINKITKYKNDENTIEDENLIPNRFKFRSRSGIVDEAKVSKIPLNENKITEMNNENGVDIDDPSKKNLEIFKQKIHKQKIINFQKAKSCLIQLDISQHKLQSNKSTKNIMRNQNGNFPSSVKSQQPTFEDFRENMKLKKNKSIADLLIETERNKVPITKAKTNKNVIVQKFDLKHKHSNSGNSNQNKQTIDSSEEQKTKEEDLEGSIIPPNFLTKISKPSYEVTQRSLFSAIKMVNRAEQEQTSTQNGFWDKMLCGASEINNHYL